MASPIEPVPHRAPRPVDNNGPAHGGDEMRDYLRTPDPRLRLYLDGSWQPTFVGGGDTADVQALDLGLDYRLTDSIEVGLAWRQLVYELEDDGADSDLDLEASGPRLSIALRL